MTHRKLTDATRNAYNTFVLGLLFVVRSPISNTLSEIFAFCTPYLIFLNELSFSKQVHEWSKTAYHVQISTKITPHS